MKWVIRMRGKHCFGVVLGFVFLLICELSQLKKC